MKTIELKVYAGMSKGWILDGKCHRENDQPAFIYNDGSLCWYRRGFRHREWNKPAVIRSDGLREWFYNGSFLKNELVNK